MLYFGLNAQIKLTQSVNSTLVNAQGSACEAPVNNIYADNSFFRAYKLSDFGVIGNFQITSLEYGQGNADPDKVVTLKIHTADTDDLSIANLSFVGSTTHTSIVGDNLSLISTPLSLVIPSGSIIVFEVFAAAGSYSNDKFRIGINNDGENDDSYLQAPSCIAFTNRTALSSVGIGTEHYVMNVIGNDVPLSIDEDELSNISVGPNPTSDMVRVKLHPSNSIQQIELYAITGRKIMELDRKSEISLKSFSAGIYLLKVVTEKGTSIKRIIKK